MVYLWFMARAAAAWKRRDKFDCLVRFVRGLQEPMVCIVYGLRRIGKATMLMLADDRQARHLRDPEKIASVDAHHGWVISRTVIYRGQAFTATDGVVRRNVEEYLTQGISRLQKLPAEMCH